ncbi:hypothetical protein [Actinoplanes siamensis]|uniref:Uncharacterized protein n=1 Tax=Actinoplanes siamensis TaxID=1223317 RepID=A0A919KBS3_9ACTN|nr:hypothetical protein [Actinoplanes siamensis]GIF02656.1 hypothetical protein Asi03nite_01940 [Actinoplanes siamensis]
MDLTLMIGPADRGQKLRMAEVAQDLAAVLGFDFGPSPGTEDLHGGTEVAQARLQWESGDNEPWNSHPILLDFAVTEPPELPYAHALFDRLESLRRYRLVLLVDHACARSTHFPCASW